AAVEFSVVPSFKNFTPNLYVPSSICFSSCADSANTEIDENGINNNAISRTVKLFLILLTIPHIPFLRYYEIDFFLKATNPTPEIISNATYNANGVLSAVFGFSTSPCSTAFV